MLKKILKRLSSLLFLAICFVGASVSAQSSEALGFPDSLLNYSCQELRNIFLPMGKDSLKAAPYLAAHTYKARRGSDTMDLVWTYRNIGYFSSPEIEAMYIDSMLQLAKQTSNFEYLSRIYTLVAIYNKAEGNFHEALQYHLLAFDFSLKCKNKPLESRSKRFIASMKSISGNYSEAIRMNKDLLNDFGDSTKTVFYKPKDLSWLFFYIFEGHMLNNELDSAQTYLNWGLRQSQLLDSTHYWRFRCYEGVLAYKNGNYETSVDILSESLPNRTNIGLFYNYFYRGNAYMKMDSIILGIYDFKKADSIGIKYNLDYQERLTIYKRIAEYYENKDDIVNQLLYIKKYLEMDSIIDLRYAVFNTKIKDTYDTPIMREKQEAAMAKLAAKNKQYKGYWAVTGGVLFTVCGLLFYNIYKRRRLKQRFDSLLADKEAVSIDSLGDVSKISSISKEVVAAIRAALDGFEQELGFLSNTLNQNVLAKQLNTNPNYLSRVINADKNKNFTSYINDLRVSHVIQLLQQDKSLRKYSIKALAAEIGYNNAESFSKAFKKTTGMYPSYFIKQLEKVDGNKAFEA